LLNIFKAGVAEYLQAGVVEHLQAGVVDIFKQE
jgi:hypothetical protein